MRAIKEIFVELEWVNFCLIYIGKVRESLLFMQHVDLVWLGYSILHLDIRQLQNCAVSLYFIGHLFLLVVVVLFCLVLRCVHDGRRIVFGLCCLYANFLRARCIPLSVHFKGNPPAVKANSFRCTLAVVSGRGFRFLDGPCLMEMSYVRDGMFVVS